MKTINTKLFAVLCGILFISQTANCSEKKQVAKAEATETTETTAKTESVIAISSPPFEKFVVVTAEESVLYKTADANSPKLVRWIESDCESDFCENIYQWSNLSGKPGFEMSTDIMACEGEVYPVLGEEGNFYKVCTLNEWCTIESAYIPKADVGDIECAPIKADMLESEEDYFKCRVMKDGKYKDIVFIDEYDELSGETFQVGVLKDGAVATPTIYHIDSSQDSQQVEDISIKESDDRFVITFNKSMADDSDIEPRLDLKKLNDGQIAKIVDTVTRKKPEYVICMFHFPAAGLKSFYYKTR